MADVLYLKDGTSEVVIGNEADVLRNLIETRLGRDCAHLFDRIRDPDIDPVDGYCTEGDNYEQDLEALQSVCHDAVNALDETLKLFELPRLNKALLEKQIGESKMSDYVDREQVRQAICKAATNSKLLQGLEKALNALDTVPAADVKPAVHAHWIYSRKNVFGECSNCGAWYDVMQGEPNDGQLDYCPHCSAIMDEVTDNG